MNVDEQNAVASYEQLFARLQALVTRLEEGALPLEESLRLYEEGVHLAAACQNLLDTAELRVQQLQAGDLALED